jgi:hypothetical protein
VVEQIDTNFPHADYEANLFNKTADGCTSLVRAIEEVAGPGVGISGGSKEGDGTWLNVTTYKSRQQTTLHLVQL